MFTIYVDIPRYAQMHPHRNVRMFVHMHMHIHMHISIH
jgi:hypothetical protein